MPKYLLDENLSRKLVDKLAPAFGQVTHVSSEQLIGCFDSEVWSFAKNNSFIIITKDNDFFDMSHLYGCPPKVIKLNCGNKTTDYIERILVANNESIKDFSDSNNCYMELL
jgi:predicted nuclease of predicted toxin-antitoxin system